MFSGFVEELNLEETPRYHDFAKHARLIHLAKDTGSVFEVLQLSGHVSVDVCRKYFERAEVSKEEFKNID